MDSIDFVEQVWRTVNDLLPAVARKPAPDKAPLASKSAAPSTKSTDQGTLGQQVALSRRTYSRAERACKRLLSTYSQVIAGSWHLS
jgi:hypothetical protein